jgi:hypothetical protein
MVKSIGIPTRKGDSQKKLLKVNKKLSSPIWVIVEEVSFGQILNACGV